MERNRSISAWQGKLGVGAKLVTLFSDNHTRGLPSEKDILADRSQLRRGLHPGRQSPPISPYSKTAAAIWT